ncbi:MAG: dihydroorotate dehydrogenase electron transfer subunit [Firmicutes bacterium]|nr:dihydroorotate dehydrogenase electron transfer subunit [Bacillota bacterium]
MPGSERLRIIENARIAEDSFRLTLSMEGASASAFRPGQFAEIAVPGFSLRRPLSFCGWDGSSVSFAYTVRGEGTAALSRMKDGELSVILPCGNGFDAEKGLSAHSVLVIGGGIGCAPLMPLIRELKSLGAEPVAVFGFRDRPQTLFREELEQLGVRAVFAYDSEGRTAVSAMKDEGLDGLYFFSCGPAPMMRALCEASSAPGQCSLETRMGCGYGACMGCSVRLRDRMARVCKDGPVFEKEEIVWQSLL